VCPLAYVRRVEKRNPVTAYGRIVEPLMVYTKPQEGFTLGNTITLK
jgi:hypothetical protein